ncbi:Serine/threonine-protein kinase PrkC [Nocardiopsis dassonvillei]|uniref:non-specific serine/threonine protein kinase n=2 Tax=Nocardiopsidaceae TaxID=83676 RepID=D7B6T4_NOCDD|nr:serine/threonine protein kinase with PASTA sensor(s) [Nocardiopsis dassonvillei subsp. dassonvillei DSM 43111]VEI90806.1 Serine/threonine-protein kinase PrkC [Nocardiopsis dassonvillei]
MRGNRIRAMETPTPDPLFGITLHERYILGKRLRSGASGTVHVAHDLGGDQTVTVTVLHPWLVGDHGAVHAFLDRAQTLEGLSHPGIARVLGHGRDGEHVYAVGEYLSGHTLAEALGEGGGGLRYPVQAALAIVAGALTALDAAHGAGVVHGALDPHTVVVDGEGGVRVTGFPLLFDAEEDAGPETRTDVHAVGRLLYTLLTGVPADPEARPLRPSAVIPGLPSDLDMLVANATDPNPRYRPRDAGQYLTVVEQVLRSLSGAPVNPADVDTRPIPVITDAPPERGEERAAPVPPWRRVPVLVTAGVLVLVLFAAGWALVPDDRVALPDLVGASSEQAEERLAGLGMDLAVRFEDAYSDTVGAGAVADSTPAPGSDVARGAEVLLHVSTGPRYSGVPDVVGGTENEARETLRQAGFTGIEIVQEHSPDQPPGTVLSTEPAAGEEGDREEPVVLSVSEGVIVPTLIGMGQEEAATALAGLGLVVQVTEEHHDTAPVGEVSGQTPEPGTILPEEAAVSLTVSLGPEPEEEEEESEEEASPSDEDDPRVDEGEQDGRGDQDGWGGRGDDDDDRGRGDGGGSCDAPQWNGGTVYDTGDRVQHDGREYEARWWIQGYPPSGDQWGVWEDKGSC